MKRQIVFLVIFLCVSFQLKAVSNLSDFQIFPNSLFEGEEKSVLFTVKAQKPLQEKVFLFELNPAHDRSRFFWEMKDDGSFGDEKAGDQIYSRVIQFKEKRVSSLWFLATSGVAEEKIKEHLVNEENFPSALKGALTIKPRPSFIEILSQIWIKIKAHFDKN